MELKLVMRFLFLGVVFFSMIMYGCQAPKEQSEQEKKIAGIQRLIASLRDSPDPRTRANMAIALGGMKETFVLPPLVQALQDENFAVRKAALKALGDLGNPAAIEDLLTFIKTPPAGRSFKQTPYTRTPGALQYVVVPSRVTDEKFELNQQAEESLIMIWQTSKDERILMYFILTQTLKPSFDNRLCGGVKDYVAMRRNAAGLDRYTKAVTLLGKCADEDSVNLLISLLDRPIDETTLAAVNSLLEIKTPAAKTGLLSAVKGLLAALKHEDESIRRRASYALEQITGRVDEYKGK
jgi:hypothetical protein